MPASRGSSCDTRPSLLIVSLVLCGASALATTSAAAQDLFELEVFRYGGVPPGDYEVELHANALSRGGVAAGSVTASHRPAHLSVEVTRGWTDMVETAVFIQTAPFGPSGSARFAGGHIRSTLRLADVPVVPLRVAVSAEYAFKGRREKDVPHEAPREPTPDAFVAQPGLLKVDSMEIRLAPEGRHGLRAHMAEAPQVRSLLAGG